MHESKRWMFCTAISLGSVPFWAVEAKVEMLVQPPLKSFFCATFWGDALVISRQTICKWHLHIFHSHSCWKPFVCLLFNDHYSDNSSSLHDGACVLQVVQSKSFFDTHPTSHSGDLKLSRSMHPCIRCSVVMLLVWRAGVLLSCWQAGVLLCWQWQMFCCHAAGLTGRCSVVTLPVWQTDVLLSCCQSDIHVFCCHAACLMANFCCHAASLIFRCSVVMQPAWWQISVTMLPVWQQQMFCCNAASLMAEFCCHAVSGSCSLVMLLFWLQSSVTMLLCNTTTHSTTYKTVTVTQIKTRPQR